MSAFEPLSADQAETNQIAGRLTAEFIDRHARLYGREPSSTRVFIGEDHLACVCEGTLTKAESTLLTAGGSEAVERTRVEVQRETVSEIVGAVELLVGRRVRAVVPQLDAYADLLLEFFLFAPEERQIL